MRIILSIMILYFGFVSASNAQISTKQKKHHNVHNIALHISKKTKGKNYYNPFHSKLLIDKHIVEKPKRDMIPKSNVKCVAETIFSEARGEPLIGQLAVGSTIITRTKLLQKNACSVVRKQYTQKRVPAKDKEEFYALAEKVLNGASRNPIGNLDSFDSFKGKHRHRKGAIKIGNHYFYKSLKEQTS